MDPEHFGGRTDDDLFADDFEPVAPEEQVATISNETGAPVPQDTNLSTPVSTAVEHSQPSEPAPVQKPAPAPQAPRGLANSRHAPANRAEKQPRNNNRHRGNNSANNNNNNNNNNATQSQQQQSTSNAPPSAPKELREKEARDKEPGRNTASVSSAARIGSGANPRSKLTEDELAAKMEKMRIMNAEKVKRFEQAQRDESEHAAAYAKGMEEDRKRRAEQAARRKAAEEDRKKMEEEREKNRERKMRAMGAKEGGSWDEGKEERMREEDRSGYRGHRGVANTAFARDMADGNEQGDGYRGGRRGGRGGFGGGRGRGGGDGYGGRTLFEPDPENESGQRFHQRDNFRNRGRDWKADGPAAPRAERAGPGSGVSKADKPKLTPDEFPALPGSKPAALPASTNAPLSFASLPLSPAVGRWDDEVQDSIWKNAAQAKEAADAQAGSKEK